VLNLVKPLQTSQESRKWLIFSTQLHRVLISSPLSLSPKARETNPSTKQKNAAVFTILDLAEENHNHSFTEVTAVSTTNLRHERKKMLLWILWKKCRQARNRPQTFWRTYLNPGYISGLGLAIPAILWLFICRIRTLKKFALIVQNEVEWLVGGTRCIGYPNNSHLDNCHPHNCHRITSTQTICLRYLHRLELLRQFGAS